ncbi:MAG: class I SAM-dependent methyltransferase [Ignavibacteria bacterium]|nr:class I SAM-dependent methyltransferase [Ignavibacteria bacterium]
MDNNTCRICNKEDNTEEYILKEMMFGWLDEFEYFKCSNCGCLQIKRIPENIGKYYPYNYVSFFSPNNSGLKKYLLKKRDLFAFTGKGILGKILSSLYGYPDFHTWFSEANFSKNDFILDVGAGKGELLLKLQNVGFNNLLGIDPFLEKDITYNKDLKILKQELSQLNNLSFDWVMFHHVFEHLKNPAETFDILKNIVKKNGKVIIRIPVIDSYAWEIYKTNWVQLDPPRHFFLHTVKSIKHLAGRFGFRINKIIYDSTAFQFWGSEQYKMNIPLMHPRSHFLNNKKAIFSKDEIRKFENEAEELNKKGKGDSACFYLENIN